MAIRSKTKRRLAILILVTTAVVGALAGAYAYRMNALEQQALRALAEGTEALESEQYFEAMHKLGTYVSWQPDDAAALYKYATARQHVVEANSKHLRDAITVLRRVLDIAPSHAEARQDLLNLYSRIGYGAEALEIAEDLLQANPQDSHAQHEKAIALMRLGRHDAALEAALAYNAMEPADIDGHIMTLSIMRRAGRPASSLVAHAQGLIEAHPEAPAFALVMAVAHRIAGEPDAAMTWLERAAAVEPPDAAYVNQLVNMLDDAGQYDRSRAIVAAFEGGELPLMLKRKLARRLWEGGQYEQVIEELADVRAGTESADASLLALKALCYSQLGEVERIPAIIETLLARQNDPVAHAWARVLRGGMLSTGVSPVAAIEALGSTSVYLPDQPDVQYLLGEAYAAVGEEARALAAWQRSAAAAPAWPAPLIRSAMVLMSTQQYQAAAQAAHQAVRRARNSLAANIVYAQAVHARLSSSGQLRAGSQAVEQLGALVAAIQQEVPGEPNTLPIAVALTALGEGPEAAKEAIKAALAAEPPLPPTAMMALATISAQHGLGLEAQVTQAAQEQGQRDPQAALAVAARLARLEGSEAGRAYLESAASDAAAAGHASATAQAALWDLAMAQYLDQQGDEVAGPTWKALAERYPDQWRIQAAALASRAIWEDLELARTTVERLRRLTGEDSLTWRIYQADVLLRSDPGDRAAAEAASLLSYVMKNAPTLVKPRLLLATAQERLGNVAAAIAQLEAASKLDTESAAIALELAQMLQAQGDRAASRAVIERVLAAPQVPPAQVRQAALTLSRLGEREEAIALLRKLHGGAEAPPELLLAVLYSRAGENELAGQIVEALLAGEPTAPIVEFAAGFYHDQGRPDDAARALAMLEDMDLQPGQAALVRGVSLARSGQAEAALAAYREAVEAAPQRGATWQALILELVAQGKREALAEALKEAASAAGEDPGVARLVRHADLLALASSRPALGRLAEALADPALAEAAAATLQVVQEATSSEVPADRQLDRLRRLADANPRFLELQTLLVRLYMAANEPSEAATVATRAMQTFPNAVDAANLATRALLASRRYSEAIDVAQRWRQLATGDTLEPDIALAQAQLSLRRYDEALAQLAPYRDAAATDPAGYSLVLALQARALIGLGAVADAAALLDPHLASEPAVRTQWVTLALGHEDTALAAQWLEAVGPHVPEDAIAERLYLAQGWYNLSRRVPEAGYLAPAQAIVAELEGREDLPAERVLAIAVLLDAEGEHERAVACYRRVLKERPADLVAMNNLAMLLARDPGQQAAALALAQEATRLQPASAPLLDTLAHVQAASGDYTAAAETLRGAVALDPLNPQWQVALAWNLMRCGQADEARTLVGRVLMEHSPERLAEPAATQLQEVQAALDKQLTQAGT